MQVFWGTNGREQIECPQIRESPMTKPPAGTEPKQLLHLVFGGELTTLDGIEFADLDKLDVVGIFPDYATAQAAWKGAAQRTVDNAHMRYFIVQLHRLLEPESGKPGRAPRPRKS